MTRACTLIVLLVACACRSTQKLEDAAPSPAVAPAAPVAEAPTLEPPAPSPALGPLVADAELVALPVEGFRDAVLFVPRGATEKRPVLVALHGNYDRPEWQCEVWREITAGHPFVLCPRGIPRADAPRSEDRWEYGALDKTERELLAALAALEKRFPDHVDSGPVLFTGFSLGAILGKHILVKHAARFPLAVLTEGGYEAWSAAMARKYREGGGQRVLFACGQAACRAAAKAAARVAEKQGLEVRVADGGNAGHTYDRSVARAIAGELGWLVAEDERWAGGVN
jgi:predicted esterase